MNLITFLTSALDGSFKSVESRNVRQGPRFVPQQSGCFREAKIFPSAEGQQHWHCPVRTLSQAEI